MQDHKASLHKFQRIDVMQTTFPDHSAIKLDINNQDSLKLPLNLDISE